MVDGGGGHWLVRMEWRPARWSVCLSRLIFPCTIKSRSSLLALVHPGGPGKRAVKRLCVCVVTWWGAPDSVHPPKLQHSHISRNKFIWLVSKIYKCSVVIDEFLTVTFTYTFTMIKHAGGSGQCLCATLELKDFQGHRQSHTLQK